MSRIVPIGFLLALAACSADFTPAAPEHLYVVHYRLPLNGADSAIIGYIGAEIVMTIPLTNAMIIRSNKEKASIDSIPDRASAVAIDSLNQVIRVEIAFKNPLAPWEISAVGAWDAAADPPHQSGQYLETRFKIGDINKLGELSNVSAVGLEWELPHQATVRRQ